MSPLRDTIDRWRDGSLPAGEQALVATRLRADPAALAVFLDEVAFDHQLAALLGDPGQAQHLAHFDDAWRAATSISGAQRALAAVEHTIDQRAARPRSARSSARVAARSSARLRAPVRRRTTWWPFAALAAAVALVVLATRPWEHAAPAPISPGGPAIVATLIRTADGTTVTRSGVPLSTTAGMELRADDQVQAYVAADLRLRDGSFVALGDHTRVVVHSVHLMALDSGSLSVSATHRPGDQALAIATPHATTTVVGTRFTVRVRDGRTRVEVDEGTVRFAPQEGRAVLVSAGGTASAPAEAVASGVIAFRFVNAKSGEPLPGYERLSGTATITQAQLRRTPIAVLALATPDDIGPVRFTVDGRAIDPPQNNPPYSLTASQSLTGAQQFTPWRPAVGRHVLRAAPVSGSGTTATLTLTVEGDTP